MPYHHPQRATATLEDQAPSPSRAGKRHVIPGTRQLLGNASENLSFAISRCVSGVRARDGFERPRWWTTSSG